MSTNRCLCRLKAFFNWTLEREYLTANPAQRVRKLREFERERRLEPGEEERLRALTKDDWLWRLRLVAALETGYRIGEILNVQFKQLRWDLNELHLSNRTTRGLQTRYIPLSQELRAMLELHRHDRTARSSSPRRSCSVTSRRTRQELPEGMVDASTPRDRSRPALGIERAVPSLLP